MSFNESTDERLENGDIAHNATIVIVNNLEFYSNCPMKIGARTNVVCCLISRRGFHRRKGENHALAGLLGKCCNFAGSP
jgi:hypothetical protein